MPAGGSAPSTGRRQQEPAQNYEDRDSQIHMVAKSSGQARTT